MVQMQLPLQQEQDLLVRSYRAQFVEAIESDMDFHSSRSTYSSHANHAFPAKFPPQIPHLFISKLTQPGDLVLDPMMGSGTTLLEAILLDRKPVGFDIDPLATLISTTKISQIDPIAASERGNEVLHQAEFEFAHHPERLSKLLEDRFDPETRKFIDYWFIPQTQLELIALLSEIEKIEVLGLRLFLTLIFSAIIITKSGGVSQARDLAHTRPHLDATKCPKSAFQEFRKRLKLNLVGMSTDRPIPGFMIGRGNAQNLPLKNNSIDLIVTSPPYANNAIDYMRANKFSLVWLGYPVKSLSGVRSTYIGSDRIHRVDLLPMPGYTTRILNQLDEKDGKRAISIHRYYSEMKRAMAEMYRVLKPGKGAAVVVATSIIRGIDVETQRCLGEIGQELGFNLVGIGTRQLDRDRRMMPARNGAKQTQIEERMHEEFVVGLLKPEEKS